MSFLPEGSGFTDFLEASLKVIQAECPAAYRELCQLLAGKRVRVTVGEEESLLTFTAQRILAQQIFETPGDASSGDQSSEENHLAHLGTSRQSLLDLIDGKLTLQLGILDGRIAMQGGIEELILFHEGWLTYLGGAARSPSIPYLLERYRSNIR